MDDEGVLLASFPRLNFAVPTPALEPLRYVQHSAVDISGVWWCVREEDGAVECRTLMLATI
jgi:hypothetical protein